jgi:prepilin-type N-terminal cleavage/methylation domain-containing protein
MSESKTSSLKRGGFTIIELLIVVAIIAVLLGLGIGAAFKVVDAQRVATTEDLLRTVDKTLHTHWKAVVDDAKKEEPSPAVKALAGDENRAKVLWIKLRLAEAFPQSYGEVNLAVTGQGIYGSNASGQPWIEPERRKYMATYYNTIKLAKGAGASAQSQASACLLMALSVSRGGTKLDQAHLANSISDSDNDTIKEILDAWGKPISFERFPIAHPNQIVRDDFAAMNPQASTNKAVWGDPLDPEGLLQTGGWHTSSGPTFAAIFTPPHVFPAGNPQPYWVPFVSSNGRDELPGTNDDLMSYRLRVGGGGD